MCDLVIYEEVTHIEITNTEHFNLRLPEIFDALVKFTAFVNNHFPKSNKTNVALIFS